MRTVKKVLDGRVMIKLLDGSVTTEGGLVIREDGESLKEALIVMVADNITQVEPGERVHYTQGRESGRCRHNDETHYIVPISNIIAVIEDE